MTIKIGGPKAQKFINEHNLTKNQIDQAAGKDNRFTAADGRKWLQQQQQVAQPQPPDPSTPVTTPEVANATLPSRILHPTVTDLPSLLEVEETSITSRIALPNLNFDFEGLFGPPPVIDNTQPEAPTGVG